MKLKFFILPVVSLLLVACERHDRPTTPQPPQTSFMDQDYTGDDMRDSGAATIFNQTDRSDQTLTQRIRQAIMADDSLSTNAKNIRITANNGIITLRGLVGSTREREIIANKANTIPGVKRVDNQIEIMRGNY